MDPLVASHHETLARGSAAEWTARVGALRALRSMARSESSILRAALGAFIVPLTMALADLRSAVVKETCVCIGDLAVAYGPAFGKVAEALIPALLKASSVTTCVIATSASEASRVLIEHSARGFSLRTVEFIAHAVVFDKSAPRSPLYRTEAAIYLGLLLRKRVHEAFPERVIQRLRSSALKGCSDRSAQVRTACRENSRYLESMEPVCAGTTLDSPPKQAHASKAVRDDPQVMATVCTRPDINPLPRKRPQRAPLQPNSAHNIIKSTATDSSSMTRNARKPPRRSMAVGLHAAQSTVVESRAHPSSVKPSVPRPARRTMVVSAAKPQAPSTKTHVLFAEDNVNQPVKSTQVLRDDDFPSPQSRDEKLCTLKQIESLRKELIQTNLKAVMLAAMIWSRKSKCKIIALKSGVDIRPFEFKS